jgi:hypothetical protein
LRASNVNKAWDGMEALSKLLPCFSKEIEVEGFEQ